MQSTSQLSTAYNVRSASKYLDETAQSAHWTVYSIARSKSEVKVQLCINSMFYLSIVTIGVGIGFVITGILDVISSNISVNFGVSLWAGALFAFAVGAMLIYFYKVDNPSARSVTIVLAVVCVALLMHIVTVALSAVAVNQQYMIFEGKLTNSCDSDPNSYYLGGQAGSSGASYNPNNPNYVPNCSPQNVQCNADPYQYALNNPASWWSTNKDTVFRTEEYYRKVFMFAYLCDVCEMVMALQLIAVEIGLIVGLRYLQNHIDDLDSGPIRNNEPEPPRPQQVEQKVMSYLNATTATPAVPPVQLNPAKPAITTHKPDDTESDGEPPVYANVHVNVKAGAPTHAVPQAPSNFGTAPADANTSQMPAGSRSTLYTVGGSASVAGLSVTSRSSRAPRGAVQTRAMLPEEAPPQVLPLKRLNVAPASAPTTVPVSSGVPPPARVGVSASSRSSALPTRHAMTKY